jgi:hypothetical protein
LTRKKTGEVLIILGSSTADWLSAIRHFAEQMKSETPDQKLTILDCSRFFPPTTWGLGVTSLRAAIQQIQLNAEIVELSRPATTLESDNKRTFYLPFVESQIHSTLRSKLLLKTNVGHFLQSCSTLEAHDFRSALSLFSKQRNFDTVVIPNGRFALSRIAADIFQNEDSKMRFLEFGWGRRLLLTNHPPHALKDYSNEVMRWRISLEGEREAEKWLNDRIESKSVDNKFNRFEEKEYPESRVVFFSSSQDEYEALGPEWNSGWKSQFEAFDSIIRHLSIDPRGAIIRVHPNTANKPFREQKAIWRDLQELRASHPGIAVIPPNSKVNSYFLARSTHLIVTNGSTIGLEAMFMGKKVISTNPNIWVGASSTPVFSKGREKEPQMFPLNPREEAIQFVARFKSLPSKSLLSFPDSSNATTLGWRFFLKCSGWKFFTAHVLARLVVEMSAALARRVIRWQG